MASTLKIPRQATTLSLSARLDRLVLSQTCLRTPTTSLPQHSRAIHSPASRTPPSIPSPTLFCPDVPTFLSLWGRKLKTHASKFPKWDDLFLATSQDLRKLGVEPPRLRRYLIKCRDSFKRGIVGIGGDAKYIDGEGKVWYRLREENRTSTSSRVDPTTGETKDVVRLFKYAEVLNAKSPLLNAVEGKPLEEVVEYNVKTTRYADVTGEKVNHVKARGGSIAGSTLKPVKGSNGMWATLVASEGLWEVKRGVKKLGGERRKRYNISKQRIKERQSKK